MRLLVVVAALSLFACGPTEGSACSTEAETTCGSATSLLSCEGGTWRGYACPSCSGTTCNWKNAKSGDACPASSAGDGWCPFNGRQVSCFFSSSADAGVFVESACGKCVEGKTTDEVGGC